MHDIVAKAIQDYLARHTMNRDPVFTEMEQYAEETGFPIIGPQVGQLLHILTRVSNASTVFEIGSGYGYSALWFALAMKSDGKVICSEYSADNIKLAEDYIRQVHVSRAMIKFRHGDGIEILRNSAGNFDIIFNDSNKEDYPTVYSLAKEKLREGGLLISDNALWHGRVVDTDPDEKTRGILEYNRMIFTSGDFFSSLIPLRDGISISLKL